MNQQLIQWDTLHTKLHQFHEHTERLNMRTYSLAIKEYIQEASKRTFDISEHIQSVTGNSFLLEQWNSDHRDFRKMNRNDSHSSIIEEVTADLTEMGREIKEVIKRANAISDQKTVKLFISIRQSVEKLLWMINVYMK